MNQCWPGSTTPLGQKKKIYRDLVKSYGDLYLANISSRNGLVPDSTKPLPEPMLTVIWAFCGVHMTAISQVLMNLIYNQCSEIMPLKVLPRPRGQWVKLFYIYPPHMICITTSVLKEVRRIKPGTSYQRFILVWTWRPCCCRGCHHSSRFYS